MIYAILVIATLSLTINIGRTFYGWPYVVNLDTVAAKIATGLIRDYDAGELGRDATIKYARDQYIKLSSYSGLPISITDSVANKVWKIIDARKPLTQNEQLEVSLYV